MLQRLLIALSQVKAGKISENLLNEIRHLINKRWLMWNVQPQSSNQIQNLNFKD